MPRLPPADKLPLAARKDVRDNWEGKREEIETKLSDILGQKWSVDVDPHTIFPYAQEGDYAKRCPGEMIAKYIEGANEQLGRFIEYYGDIARDELNDVCSEHTISIDYAEDSTIGYNNCTVNDGELVILFTEGNLGVNIDDPFEKDKLRQALDKAGKQPMSFSERQSVDKDFNKEIGPVKEKLDKILGRDITIDCDWETLSAKLREDKEVMERWNINLGGWVKQYFEGLVEYLQYNKFGEDDMLQEGLNEAMESGKVSFRVVDSLKENYNECAFEDGVLYLQTLPKHFGVNVGDAARQLMDLL